jgi:uncharacterized protein
MGGHARPWRKTVSEFARVKSALSEPGFYPHRPRGVTVLETHTSCVFLAGDRAYKLKKPVQLGFLDYSGKATRKRLCREEVRLNRRLAPSVYLGVRAVVQAGDHLTTGDDGDPAAVDYLVEMRRFDERRTLAARIGKGGVGAEEIRELGRLLARFHAGAPPARTAADPREAIRRTVSETFSSLHDLASASLVHELLAAERFTGSYLVAHRGTFLDRAASGLVRDVHGDLRAEHVVLENPIVIVDCLEFDPALRQIDVAEDLAFLTMDLQRLGAPDLAAELVAAYRDAGGDPGDDSLLAFHAAQRAWVRAKVELLRASQVATDSKAATANRDEAGALARLARRFRWRARQPLVLVVCGSSGSGKSYLAAALAESGDIAVLASDVVRKQLAGIEPTQPGRPEHYSASFSRLTYRTLGELAAAELERSGLVIVDATFRRRTERAQFAAGAGALPARVVFVECVAPRSVRIDRIERRGSERGHASDATFAVARRQRFSPLTEVAASHHLPLRTDRDIDDVVWAVEAWLD